MASESDFQLDIASLRARLTTAEQARRLLDKVYTRIEHYPDKAVWIDLPGSGDAQAQLEFSVQRMRQGSPQPLFGIPFAVKDNIDVAGRPTTAGCPAFAYTPEKSATVVSRLCDAGAILIGKTNLDQFATGLVGTRSPYGACQNVFDSRYISGGSSSGSAVAVAAGMVCFALGTDTAGSGRVPAAFNNIVGLKPSRGFISAAGVVPACRSLDCVSIFAQNCADAATIFEIAAGYDPADPFSRTIDDLPPPRAWYPTEFRFGVPRHEDLAFFGNADAESLFKAAITRLADLGGTQVTIDYQPFSQAASLLYDGPWIAERTTVVQDLLQRDPNALLPVTRSIVERGLNFSAVSAFQAQYKLAELKQITRPTWEQIDLLLLPTTGTIYTRAEVEADPIRLNTNLGYFTNFVNLMDLCALAIPSGFQKNGLPVGIQLIAPAGQESALIKLAEGFSHALKR